MEKKADKHSLVVAVSIAAYLIATAILSFVLGATSWVGVLVCAGIVGCVALVFINLFHGNLGFVGDDDDRSKFAVSSRGVPTYNGISSDGRPD